MDTWRPGKPALGSVAELCQVAYRMVAQVESDLRPWEHVTPPYWRFCVHPATYSDLEYLAATDTSMLIHQADPALNRDMDGLRLFGLLVVLDPGVTRDVMELRYTYRQDLPKATNDPGYTGDRRPHP